MNGNSSFQRGNPGGNFIGGNFGGGTFGGGTFGGVRDVVSRAYRQFLNVPAPLTEEQQLMRSIDKAQTECRLAENRFNQATDPDLIDQAIYDMMAAKTKYAYLLKMAKEMDLHG